jgi:hypothetical protein
MREHRVFKALLQMIPDLETRLMDGSDDVVGAIAKMVCYKCFLVYYYLIIHVDSERRINR